MKLLPFVLLVVCACYTETQWEVVASPEADLASDTRFEEAVAIKTAMVEGLTAKLGAAIAESGPAGAIEVCKTVAPAAAKKMGMAHDARVGRTSFRLRNPGNRAPVWLASVVDDAATASAEGEYPKADGQPLAWRGPSGELGVAFPLPVQAKCLACHGTESTIAEATHAALAELYPGDEATGFAEGDLRGWLWVELP
jgi:hypothetical protein